MVEHRGFEPLTSTLPVWRAPNCANAPYKIIIASIYLLVNSRFKEISSYANQLV